MAANSPAPENGLNRIVELDAENPAGCREVAELDQNSAGSPEKAELNLRFIPYEKGPSVKKLGWTRRVLGDSCWRRADSTRKGT